MPARMSNFGATYNSNSYCTSDAMTTDGDLLMGGSQMISQKSCAPNTGNVGNYYGFVAAVAGDNVPSGEARDSVCPRGWQLPNDKAYTEDKTFASITLAYVGISDNEDVSSSVEQSLRESAASFIRGGYYSGASSNVRGSGGYYWSSQAYSSTYAYGLSFTSMGIYPRYNRVKSNGFTVRCVAR